MLDTRKLNCLIEGEYYSFSVTVGRDLDVSELKEDIRKKRELGTLKDVDPQTLELLKVSTIDEQCEVTLVYSRTLTGRH